MEVKFQKKGYKLCKIRSYSCAFIYEDHMLGVSKVKQCLGLSSSIDSDICEELAASAR